MNEKIRYYYGKSIDYLNKNSIKDFKFLHIPKTGGTYVRSKLSWEYIEGHDFTIYKLATLNKLNFKPYSVIRNPFDYYRSLFSEHSINALIHIKKHQKNSIVDTRRFEFLYNLIADNEEVITSNENLLDASLDLIKGINYRSNSYVFGREKKLNIFEYISKFNIGIYTFFFLNHFTRKKIEEINTEKLLLKEISLIKNDITFIKLDDVDNFLKELSRSKNIYLKKYFIDKNVNFKKIKLTKSQIEKIKHKERYLFENFNFN